MNRSSFLKNSIALTSVPIVGTALAQTQQVSPTLTYVETQAPKPIYEVRPHVPGGPLYKLCIDGRWGQFAGGPYPCLGAGKDGLVMIPKSLRYRASYIKDLVSGEVLKDKIVGTVIPTDADLPIMRTYLHGIGGTSPKIVYGVRTESEYLNCLTGEWRSVESATWITLPPKTR